MLYFIEEYMKIMKIQRTSKVKEIVRQILKMLIINRYKYKTNNNIIKVIQKKIIYKNRAKYK